MKKHALLIIAHQNAAHLQAFFDIFLSHEAFDIYLHINRKSSIKKNEIENLKNHKKVKFLSRKYRVRWGGANVMNAILHLSKKALEDNNISYIHVLSGQDFPIKTPQKIFDYFENNNYCAFIEYFKLPYHGWDFNTLERFQFFHFYDIFDFKTKFGRLMIRFLLRVEKILGFNRQPEKVLPPLYGGSNWFSLSRDCIKYCLNYLEKNPQIISFYQKVFAPEESILQTILCNSEYKEKIINQNLTYIDWNYRNGNSPAVLDESDFEKLINSEKLFARKFESPISDTLRDNLLLTLSAENKDTVKKIA